MEEVKEDWLVKSTKRKKKGEGKEDNAIEVESYLLIMEFDSVEKRKSNERGKTKKKGEGCPTGNYKKTLFLRSFLNWISREKKYPNVLLFTKKRF